MDYSEYSFFKEYICSECGNDCIPVACKSYVSVPGGGFYLPDHGKTVSDCCQAPIEDDEE